MPSQRYRYQKNILHCLFFCKNEACVNCGTLNATTLIWLLPVWQFLLSELIYFAYCQEQHPEANSKGTLYNVLL